MQVNQDDRSLGELFADLAKESSVLVRQEVALAKAEMTQKAGQVGKDIGFLAVGGLVLYAGLLAIIAAIIIVLGTIGVPWWLAALVVGVIVAGVGYFLVQRGLQALKRENLAPKQTIETLKEDAEWAKEQVR
ncbi:MAG: phage holin family protein [Chloroflexota bacterium]|nr:phage holin family protein [Chloroflexota bacterium]MDQ5866256.1 phage holin family protein [Chloroflexota bacterium]